MKLSAEFFGTLIFISSIFLGKDIFAAGVGLVAALYIVGGVSGGHLNPAITIGMFARGRISWWMSLLYITVQILAGLASWLIYRAVHSTPRV